VKPWLNAGGRRCIARRILRLRDGRPARDQKNSPSRFRFRPPLEPTFPFRVLPLREASTYSRSVLDASGKVRHPSAAVKDDNRKKTANCEQ
jgi:hypothetical protein